MHLACKKSKISNDIKLPKAFPKNGTFVISGMIPYGAIFPPFLFMPVIDKYIELVLQASINIQRASII